MYSLQKNNRRGFIAPGIILLIVLVLVGLVAVVFTRTRTTVIKRNKDTVTNRQRLGLKQVDLRAPSDVVTVKLSYNKNQNPTVSVLSLRQSKGFAPTYLLQENSHTLEILDETQKLLLTIPFVVPNEIENVAAWANDISNAHITLDSTSFSVSFSKPKAAKSIRVVNPQKTTIRTIELSEALVADVPSGVRLAADGECPTPQLSAVSTAPDRINLSWSVTDQSNVKSYVIRFAKKNQDGTWTEFVDLPGVGQFDNYSQTGFAHTSLTPETTFSYVANTLCLDNTGSLVSNQETVTTQSFLGINPSTQPTDIPPIPGQNPTQPTTIPSSSAQPPATIYIPQVTTRPTAKPKSQEFFDIAFTSGNFQESELETFRQDAQRFQDYLINIEPYKGKSGKIKFHIVENTTDLSCQFIPHLVCDDDKIMEIVSAKVPFDVIQVIYKSDDINGAVKIGSIVATLYNGQGSEIVFAHEISHALRLLDEYFQPVYGKIDDKTRANCYAGQPPAQAWQGIVADSDYKAGCTYTNWYRSTEYSIMSDGRQVLANENYRYFNEISKKILNESIDAHVLGPSLDSRL